jgi:hypothetical protein
MASQSSTETWIATSAPGFNEIRISLPYLLCAKETEVTGDWALFFAAANLIISGSGLSFIAMNLVHVRRQMSRTQTSEIEEVIRRRRQATVDAYNATQHYRQSLTGPLPDDWDDEAVREFLDSIRGGDVKSMSILHDYLSHLETFSVAVSAGVYDIEVLDSLCGPRLIHVMKNYCDYIHERRALIKYAGYCGELEWLAGALLQRMYSGTPYTPLYERPSYRPSLDRC